MPGFIPASFILRLAQPGLTFEISSCFLRGSAVLLPSFSRRQSTSDGQRPWQLRSNLLKGLRYSLLRGEQSIEMVFQVIAHAVSK